MAAQDWWRGAVIYEIYPRSFQDSSGDGIGDLEGIIRRLPYVASLGVDAIWLAPFFKSPMDDMGYDVSEYREVDPMFGTIGDVDHLIAKAHDLGLKVIIDQVLSHTSDAHHWFEESRSSRDNGKADWYIWADPKPDGSPPNNWLSVFGGPAWEWDGVRRQYYMHNFLVSQPDLNFHNPDVRKALIEEMRFWLERGVDGFRLDTSNFYFQDEKLRDNPPLRRKQSTDIGLGGEFAHTNPYEYQDHLYDKTQPENLGFLKQLRSLLDSYEGRTSVGEVSDGARSLKTVAAYTSGGDKLHMCYTFDLLRPDFSAAHFRKAVSSFQKIAEDGWVCWAFSNHDVNRHVGRWLRPGEDPARLARFSIALLATLRGSICLYQGEELGLQDADLQFEDLTDPYGIRFWPAYKGRDGCRTPMPWEKDQMNAGFSSAARTWLPVPDSQRKKAVDAQEITSGSTLNHYRDILAFRRDHAVLRAGQMKFLPEDGEILAFTREDNGQRLLFAFNLDRKPADWRIPEKLKLAEQVRVPGFSPVLADGTVELGSLDVFCARLV